MELKDVLLARRSCRKYTDELVSDEDMNELLHAAMSGPSAMNKRPWDFFAIQNQEILKSVVKCLLFANYGAKAAIVVVGDVGRALPLQMKDFWVQDCSAATENILLRATDLGLGAVWCGVYPQKKPIAKLQEVLGLKEKQVPLNVILLGHPKNDPEPRDQYEEKRVHIIK